MHLQANPQAFTQSIPLLDFKTDPFQAQLLTHAVFVSLVSLSLQPAQSQSVHRTFGEHTCMSNAVSEQQQRHFCKASC